MIDLDRNLAEIRQQIQDALVDRIESEMASEGHLSDIEKVDYGNKVEFNQIKGNTPYCWIIQAPHTPEVGSVNAEDHGFKFQFALLTTDNDPVQGRKDSEDIMARTYDVITEYRRLNNTVHDSFPGELRWGLDFPKGNNYFWSGFEFIYKVRRYRKASTT